MENLLTPSTAPNQVSTDSYLNNGTPFLRYQTQLTYSSSLLKRRAAEQQLCQARPQVYGAARATWLWNQVKP